MVDSAITLGISGYFIKKSLSINWSPNLKNY
jgi:hypothetical protein